MTTTTLKARSLINGQWAEFTCEKGSSEITIKHPDGTMRTIEYTRMNESDLTIFAYGYCYGFDKNKQ